MTLKTKTLQTVVESVLGNKMPLLSKKTLQAYVQGHFREAKKYLDLLKHHPLPLYVLDTAVLKQRAHYFQQAFSSVLPHCGYYFAVKSNNHPNVAKTLVESGFGLDVSSGPELAAALRIDCNDIVFSGPGKTEAELLLAVNHHHRVTVLMDSFSELMKLQKIAAAQGVPIRAGVRLTTMPKGLWKKFGILVQDLPEFFVRAKSCTHVHLCGLQFHTSWNMNPDAQIAFIKKLGRVIANLPESFSRQIAFVDIGGGYWPEQGEWLRMESTPVGILKKALGLSVNAPRTHFHNPAVPIEVFAKKIAVAAEKWFSNIWPCKICFEPGRWVCHPAMHLFISVVDKKTPDLVVCDAGTNAVGWERYEMDYCPVLNLTRPSAEEKVCHILGALCTPHDVWGATYFGADIQPGDILMIPDQGAYTYSLHQQFIKPVPPVVIV